MLKDGPHLRQGTTDPRGIVKTNEQPALEMLVEFFDWLASLEPQPTTEEVVPYPPISAWMDQVTPKKAQNAAIFTLPAGGTRVFSVVGARCELEAHNPPTNVEAFHLANETSKPSFS